MKNMPDSFGMAGRAFHSRQTVSRDFPDKPVEEWNEYERATGVQLRTMVAVPLMLEDEEPIGVVQLINKLHGPFDETDQAVLDIVAAVSTMGFVNARLTEEASRASTLLGMGKVSHDIGNLSAGLHASLASADGPVQALRSCVDGDNGAVYVEMLNETLLDLKGATDRITGYAQLISDLSAGRPLRPHFVVTSLAETIRQAGAYLEPECANRRIDLRYEIQEGAPRTAHDELFVFRIVQNLMGNAIKAILDRPTGEDSDSGDFVGSIVVRYRYEDGKHVLEVEDSGPGMTPETARRILSGNARSQWEKAGGSGWGTKIVLELAAAHQAEMGIQSRLGHGSTFCVVFPHRDVTGNV
jgi:signal transduction histidine kinase